MSQYDKILILVDVEKDRDQKTKKISEIICMLNSVKSVKNISRIEYINKGK